MREKKEKILWVLMLAITVCMLASCAAFRGEAELMDRIAKDYEEYYYQQWGFRTSFEVEYCYGTYDDCVFVMMIGEGISTSQANRDVEVGGVMFHYRDGNYIEVWKDGEFYSLEEAYEQGLISDADLTEVADIHNNVRYKTQTD